MRAEGVDRVGTKSTDTDVVTAADRAVERLVARRAARPRPGDAVLGEESGGGRARPGGRRRCAGSSIRSTAP